MCTGCERDEAVKEEKNVESGGKKSKGFGP